MRQQHRGGIVTRSDEADANASRPWYPGPGGSHRFGVRAGLDRPFGRLRVRRQTVGQQKPDALEGTRAEPAIDVGRILDGVGARDQRPHVHRTVREQIEEAGQVTALGPANVARWVVHAFEFVAIVVSTRTVGTGEADVQLLFVICVPRQIESRLADVDHSGPVPREAGRDLDGSVRVPPGGQHDMVRAQAAGAGEQDLLNLAQARLVGCGAGDSADLLRGSAAGRDDIQAHHLNAGRDEETYYELPDEPEPDNTRGL